MATTDRRCYSPRTRSPALPPPIIPPGAVRLFPDRSNPAVPSRKMEEHGVESNIRGNERDFCIQKLAEFNQSLRRAESASTKFRWEHLLAGRAADVPVKPDKENERISISNSPTVCGIGNENRFTDRKLPLGFYPLPSDNDPGVRKNVDDSERFILPDGSSVREDRSIGNNGGSSSLRIPAFVGDSRCNTGFGASTGRLIRSCEVAGSYRFRGDSISNPSLMPEHGCCGPSSTEELTKSRAVNGILDSNAETYARNGRSSRDELRERPLNQQHHCCSLPLRLHNLVGGSCFKEQYGELRDSNSAYLSNQHGLFFNNEGRTEGTNERRHGDITKSGGIGGVVYSNAETVAVNQSYPRDDLRDDRASSHQHQHCYLPPSFRNLVGGSRLKEQDVEFRDSNSTYLRSQQETFFNNEGLPSRKGVNNEMGYGDVTKSGDINGFAYSNAETFGVNSHSPRDDLGEKEALNHQHYHCSLPPNYHDLVGGSHLKEQGKEFWDSHSAYRRSQQETYNNEGLPSRKDEIDEMGNRDVTEGGGIDSIVYSNAETYGVNGRFPRDDLRENRALNHQHQHCSLPPNYRDLVRGSHQKEQGKEFWDSNTSYLRNQQETFSNNEEGEINEMEYGHITKRGGIDGIVYSNVETFGVSGSSPRNDIGENGTLNYQHHSCSLAPSYDGLVGRSRSNKQDEEFLDSSDAYLRNQQEIFFSNEGPPYRKDEDSLNFGMTHLQNPSSVFGERQLPRQKKEEVMDSNFNHLQNQDGMVSYREDCDLGSYHMSQHDTNSYVSQGSTRQLITAEDQRNGKQSLERRIIDLRKVKERPRKRSKAERNSRSPDDSDIMRSDDESNKQFPRFGVSGLKRRQDASALHIDDLGSQRSVFAQGRLGEQRSVFAQGRLGEPINSSSRKSVKERLGLPQYGVNPNPKPLPWLNQDKKKKLQNKSSNDFGDRIQVQSGDLPEVKVKCANSESPEDSEEFKRQVHVAFLKFVKVLYENSANRKIYTERRGTGIIKCCVCDSSKEFMETQGLVTHAFSSRAVGLRAEHLGLHRALCIVMGWDSTATSKHSWFPKALRYEEIMSVKEELIIWSPVVLIHNSSIANTNSDDRLVVSNEELGAIIQGMGFSQGIFKIRRGKPANQSIMVVMFHGTFSGLQEAERLHQLYTHNKHGRAEFNQISPRSRKTQAEKVESVLYGYMGIADDLEKLDFETKRRCVVKSKKEILALADAQNLY